MGIGLYRALLHHLGKTTTLKGWGVYTQMGGLGCTMVFRAGVGAKQQDGLNLHPHALHPTAHMPSCFQCRA